MYSHRDIGKAFCEANPTGVWNFSTLHKGMVKWDTKLNKLLSKSGGDSGLKLAANNLHAILQMFRSARRTNTNGSRTPPWLNEILAHLTDLRDEDQSPGRSAGENDLEAVEVSPAQVSELRRGALEPIEVSQVRAAELRRGALEPVQVSQVRAAELRRSAASDVSRVASPAEQSKKFDGECFGGNHPLSPKRLRRRGAALEVHVERCCRFATKIKRSNLGTTCGTMLQRQGNDNDSEVTGSSAHGLQQMMNRGS